MDDVTNEPAGVDVEFCPAESETAGTDVIIPASLFRDMHAAYVRGREVEHEHAALLSELNSTREKLAEAEKERDRAIQLAAEEATFLRNALADLHAKLKGAADGRS